MSGKSYVFEHFEIPKDATGTVKAKCKHCLSTISGPAKSTSNFLTHLKVSVMIEHLMFI